jgi:hypothetical protein
MYLVDHTERCKEESHDDGHEAVDLGFVLVENTVMSADVVSHSPGTAFQ